MESEARLSLREASARSPEGLSSFVPTYGPPGKGLGKHKWLVCYGALLAVFLVDEVASLSFNLYWREPGGSSHTSRPASNDSDAESGGASLREAVLSRLDLLVRVDPWML